MSHRLQFLPPDALRIFAQWAGVFGAAIPGGVLFGVLLRLGIKQQESLAIATITSGVMAALLWRLISRSFHTPTPLAIAFSPIQLQGIMNPYPVAALTVVIVAMSISQHPAICGDNQPITMAAYNISISSCDAIPGD
jgi:hypothetical protein